MLKKIISSMALCLVLAGASNQLQGRAAQRRTRNSPCRISSDFIAQPVIQPSAPMTQNPVVQESAIKEKEECADCKKWAKALQVREKQLKEKKSTSWLSYLLPLILGFFGGTLNQSLNKYPIPGLGFPLRLPNF